MPKTRMVSPHESPTQLQQQLEDTIRGKCGTQSNVVIEAFDRMRNVKDGANGISFDFYAGTPKTAEDSKRNLIELLTLCNASVMTMSEKIEEPPSTPDTVESIRTKIGLANAIDWSRLPAELE